MLPVAGFFGGFGNVLYNVNQVRLRQAITPSRTKTERRGGRRATRMDPLTYQVELIKAIAQLIGALAWPLAALVIFLLLRVRLLRLIPLLQRLRLGEVEFDFGTEMQALAVEAEGKVPPLQLPVADTPVRDAHRQVLEGATEGNVGELASPAITGGARRLRDRLAQLAPMAPRAVILEGWLYLEQAAIDAARRHELKLSSSETRAPQRLQQALQTHGLLDAGQLQIFNRLRNLRNAAAHASDFDFDPDSAIEYADLAIRLAEYLHST
jgi:hypothetical protein